MGISGLKLCTSADIESDCTESVLSPDKLCGLPSVTDKSEGDGHCKGAAVVLAVAGPGECTGGELVSGTTLLTAFLALSCFFLSKNMRKRFWSRRLREGVFFLQETGLVGFALASWRFPAICLDF